MEANLAVAKLPQEDIEILNHMDKGKAGRTVEGPEWGIQWF